MTEFCEKCNNILDITRNIVNINMLDSPSLGVKSDKESISNKMEDSDNFNDDIDDNPDDNLDNNMDNADDDAANEDDVDNEDNVANVDDVDNKIVDMNKPKVNYKDIIKKVENGQKLTNDEILSINVKDMIQDEYYRKINQKNKIKKLIIDMIDDLGNSDENVQAYLLCTNCYYHRPIDQGFRIMSKNQEGTAYTHDYVNEALYRNYAYQRTLPITRNFKCTNELCPSNKDNVVPEAVFLRKDNTYNIIYVCKYCKSIKLN